MGNSLQKITLFFVLIILHCMNICFAISHLINSSSDESALLAFGAQVAASDPAGNIVGKNWTSGTSFCGWIGITCSRRHQRVTAMNLSHMSLSGAIPIEIGNLSFLVSLDLSRNSLHGGIPDELSHLRRLRFLYLDFNQLTGSIPSSLPGCTKLQVLSMTNNFITGSIPDEIGNFSKLEKLSLDYNNLTGKFPSTIFNMSSLVQIGLSFNEISDSFPQDPCYKLEKLEFMDFSRNQLHGHISSCVSHCRALKHFDLSRNRLTGILPREIGNLSTIQFIKLSLNNFTGNLPSEVGNLPLLNSLNIHSNGFFGSIPPSLGNLSNLENLYFGTNSFSGKISPEFGQLYHLKWFDVGVNNLEGEIPQSIFNISEIRIIQLLMNSLSGDLPTLISKVPRNLERLLLGSMLLSGSIPTSISNASQLTVIDVGDNLLSGHIPMALGNLGQLQILRLEQNLLTNDPMMSELCIFNALVNCTNLIYLLLDSNPLNGILPKSIGNLSLSLEYFNASNSGIKGAIPKEIGNLRNLIFLDLELNELNGSIPEELDQLRKMQLLSIGSNKIEGPIPGSLCNIKELYFLSLRVNELSGPLPLCLGDLPSLRELHLDSNALNSPIPPTLWSNKGISVLNLSSNIFTGSLAPEIGSAKGLMILDLSNNRFSGFIPSTLGQLQNLVTLGLSRNRLNGSIPQSLVNLGSLEFLDLSVNSLSGIIPEAFGKLNYLVYFNVSFNQLRGEIPGGGPFANFTAESFIGNAALCGAFRFKVRECENQENLRQNEIRVLRYILPSVLTFLVAVALIICLLRRRHKKSLLPVSTNLQLGLTHKWISYYEILHATSNFDESNLIGRGGLGKVYKGTFSGGMVAAVKVFNTELQDAFKSFDVECNVIRNIRHRNLVKVISSCSNLDFKALVLKYMANGNLEKWLYSHNNCLDTIQRLNIMIDVGSALEYLHQGHSFPVVHCDLKPSNILLDEDMVAHVADFGISKLLTEDQLMAHSKTLGTIGYIAPEYGSTGMVSTACDVYSYGILLMETFTRRKPTDDMFRGELTLKRWVSEAFPDAVMDIIDANLLARNGENAHDELSCFASIMDLALECTTDLPEFRIKTKDVLVRIKKIRTKVPQTAAAGGG